MVREFLQTATATLLLISSNANIAMVPIVPDSNIGLTAPVVAQEPAVKVWDRAAIVSLVNEVALNTGASSAVMLRVMECENKQFDPKKQSDHYLNGVREESYGLVQINLPSWPEISYKQAIDPVFSVNFLAQKLVEGKGSFWTCYRQIYGSK